MSMRSITGPHFLRIQVLVARMSLGVQDLRAWEAFAQVALTPRGSELKAAGIVGTPGHLPPLAWGCSLAPWH